MEKLRASRVFGFCSLLKVEGRRAQTSPRVGFGRTKNVKSLHYSLLQVGGKSLSQFSELEQSFQQIRRERLVGGALVAAVLQPVVPNLLLAVYINLQRK